MGETDKVLQIEDINTYYGNSHVIQGLSLHVDRREAVSILGRNGVGKTTTLRTIMGLTPPRSGTIKINGVDVTRWPAHKVCNMGLAYVPAERHIFPGLSVEENLKLAEKPGGGDSAWDYPRVYQQFPVLEKRRKQDGSTLSGGEQQMLAIGRALMSNPRMMILDEPSQGLAPLIVELLTSVVIDCCRESGITLLLVEQNFRMALKVASRHYLMGIKGKISGVATTDELLANQEIIKNHLAV